MYCSLPHVLFARVFHCVCVCVSFLFDKQALDDDEVIPFVSSIPRLNFRLDPSCGAQCRISHVDLWIWFSRVET